MTFETDTVYSGITDKSAGAEFGGFPRNMERCLSPALPLPPVTAAVEIRIPSPEVNEANAEDEDLDYDSHYDEEFDSEEDDEAWRVPDLPVRKRSLDGVTEPVRSGTPPRKLKVDVEVDVPEPRTKKRNSEELEVVRDGAGRERFQTEDIVESPAMSLENSDHSSLVPPLA
ncbi:hypothetical protein IW261DRAFT_1570996 [Armillaria novae-zelandiae]|uniref:Uncharacterized protein n=1 Tax=Armillaria novae-zelandiae TaxID=153914 RepID=A0AA39NVW1_9AGAR|nr:hypothetical protein IW261DRAFT_1570996 [Armillaria novae-zelandiae]